jgi:hypothetical protein
MLRVLRRGNEGLLQKFHISGEDIKCKGERCGGLQEGLDFSFSVLAMIGTESSL